METYNQLFLQALKAALEGKQVQWNMDISGEDWLALMNQACLHKVLPMIYDAVYDCPAAESMTQDMRTFYKNQMKYQVVTQARGTAEFLQLWQELREAELTPLIVKGLICRNLYPNPDFRLSADEDVLIPKEQYARFHDKMLAYGLELAEPEKDIKDEYVVSYIKKDSSVFIEAHKALFAPESDVFKDWNGYFSNVFKHSVCQEADGIEVLTLGYTDHLLYLIFHAFKHFLYSGFGIRQVCDITLYANAYGSMIDWERIGTICREMRAERFCIALFKIGKKYLTFAPQMACYPQKWDESEVDETAMLEDLLRGGVYGKSDRSRLHSGNMTLHAVEAHKKGKKVSGNILRVVFPEVKELQPGYPYLKKYPYLVPVAWMERIIKYKREMREDNNAMESIRIGNQRIELLKQYGVIGE